MEESDVSRQFGHIDWGRLANSWGKHPLLFKKGFRDVVSLSWFLEVLSSARTALLDGEPVQAVIYAQDTIGLSGWAQSKRRTIGVDEFLPADCETLDVYFDRVRSIPNHERFAITLKQLHTHPNFWQFTRNVLRCIYQYIHMPTQFVDTSMSIGNYAHSPIGVHQDKCMHSIKFMAHGTRTIRLWKPSIGDKLFGTDAIVADYSSDIDQSFSYNLEPGDVLYVPPEFWHVGENSEQPSLTVCIDFIEGDVISWELDQLRDLTNGIASSLIRDVLGPRTQSPFVEPVIPEQWEILRTPTPIFDASRKIASAINSEDIIRLACESWIRRQSSLGLSLPMPRRRGPRVRLDTIVRGNTKFPALLIEVGSTALIGSNGNVMTLHASESWRRLLEYVNSGHPYGVSTIIAGMEHEGSTSEVIDIIQKLWEYRGVEVEGTHIAQEP